MPGPPLVAIEAFDQITVCRIEGDLDAFTAPAVRQALATVVAAPGVVIDLSRLRFIDSSGLGVLVGTVRRVREIGGTVVLCAASPAVSRALSLSGLSRIVDITADLDEARRLLDPSPVVPTPSSGRALRP